MDDHDEEKRTEFICVRSGKSEAEVTNNRRLHALDVWYRVLKLTILADTEASRGLSAVAGPLFIIICHPPPVRRLLQLVVCTSTP